MPHTMLITLKTKDRQFDNFGDIVSMTTYHATSDNKIVELMIFLFQWSNHWTSTINIYYL